MASLVFGCVFVVVFAGYVVSCAFCLLVGCFVLWCVVIVGLHKFRCVGGVGGFLLFWSCCGIVPGFRLSWLGCDGILGFPVGLVVYLWVLWFWWFGDVLRVFSVLLDC